MRNKLWVIIPFYLDADALKRCLAALQLSSFQRFEVFVHDNSQDNIFFTAAVNEGLKAGLADPSVSNFLVLNQDCYLEQTALELLLAHLGRYPKCGIACPLQRDSNKHVTWAGSLQALPWGHHCAGPLEDDSQAFPTYWANGACMLIRRAVVEEIGLFDKNFRFICSDSDFSFTARTRGWEVHVVPYARAEHALSGSTGKASAALELIKTQDALYFYEKWLSGDLYRRISHEGPTLITSEMESWALGLRTTIQMETTRPEQQVQVGQLFQQGLALHQQGQLAQAQELYAQVLAEDKQHVDALHLLGVTLYQTQNFALAAAFIGKALKINPNHAAAHANMGLALQGLGCLAEAVVSYDKAISIEANNAQTYLNRGNALIALERLEAALGSFDQAIAIQADYADAHVNRGRTLDKLNRFDEAVASYDQAIKLQADHPQAHLVRGNTLQELGRLEDALASYDQAIALKTDDADAYWSKSLALLLAGQFKPGWTLYEWRWPRKDFSSPTRNFTQPLWRGAEDIQGKTILLHAEQGLGDSLQFCRYAKQVANLGATVVLEVPRPLVGLLCGLAGVDQLIEQGQALPPFDYHCPLLSLPLAFQTELDSIPSPTPYLSSTADKRQAWSQRLGKQTRPRIGIVWNGSAVHQTDHKRSLTLAEFMKDLPDGFDYVSLQKELRDVDRDELKSRSMQHWGDDITDFTDTAALCDLVDRVVSVDTSVAHLAAALGKPTWILLPHMPDWRWLLEREDSPWYASVKLYRQGEDRQWAPVLSRVARDLLEL